MASQVGRGFFSSVFLLSRFSGRAQAFMDPSVNYAFLSSSSEHVIHTQLSVSDFFFCTDF